MQGFNLFKLRIVNHDKEICNIDFTGLDFLNRQKPLTTVIIGSNGSGKSYLLKLISDVFNYIDDSFSRRKVKFRYEYFYFEYFINGYMYTVEMKSNAITRCKCNTFDISYFDIVLPSKVLAVSFMINDKFLFSNNKNPDESMYIYLGVRKTSNSTYTSSLVRSVTNNIIHSIEKEKTAIICDALSLMNMKHKVCFEINVASKRIASILKDNIILRNYLEKNIDKLPNFNDNLIEKLINAIKHINFGDFVFWLDEINDINKNLINFMQYRSEINALIDLNILKPISIYFFKNHEKISFENCSSGEKHIIFTFSSISINLYANSVVLIDESEISLHPNWQIRYINLLKKTFAEYASCHFILATHSHYIISDLESDSSSIVVVKRDADNEVNKAELLSYDTYAWSAENIIYNVFSLRTTRNYYFEMDLRDLLESIQSKNPDMESIKRLYYKLSNYALDKNDPLKKVLEEVEVYLDVSNADDHKD